MASPHHAADWSDKVKFMRDNGVETAKWDNNGFLVECHLGPDPKAIANDGPKQDIRKTPRELLTLHASQLIDTGKLDGQ